MPNDKSTQKTTLLFYTERKTVSPVNDYVNNEPLIRNLLAQYEIAAAAAISLQERIHALELEVDDQKEEKQKIRMDLNLVQQRLDNEIESNKRRSTITFILSLFATAAVAIGVNIITSNQSNMIGFIIVIFGLCLEVAIFWNQKR
jgi:molecular chaperone GrpE (heat shock protein)